MKPTELKEGETMTISRGATSFYLSFIREYGVLMMVVSGPEGDTGTEDSASKQLAYQFDRADEPFADKMAEQLLSNPDTLEVL